MPEEALAGLDPGLDISIDTTTVDTSPTEVDTGADAQISPETTETTESAPAAPGERETAQKPIFQDKLGQDGKKVMDPAIKGILDKIKGDQSLGGPVAAARIRNALQQGQAIRDAAQELFPGSKGTAADLRQAGEQLRQLEERGGLEKIDQYLQTWDTVANYYIKGDTQAFIKDLIETDENAFRSLAPAVFEQFRALDQNGYSAYVSQVLLADMQQQGVPVAVQLIEHFMAGIDNPTMKQAFEQLKGYFTRVGKLAEGPVVTPKAIEQPDARANELQTREDKLTRQEWTSQAITKRREIYDSAWRSLIGNRQLTAADAAEIKEFYGLKMQQMLKADPKFNSTLERYYGAKDQKGYLRYLEASDRKNVELALKYAVGRVIKPGAPAAAPKPQPHGQKPGAPRVQPAQGFEMRNKRPEIEEINMRHPQAREWMMEHKALLTNGKKVQWA